MSPERVIRVGLHELLHAQGGVACPHRVVLVSDGGTEQRHDPVAHHLVDRALEAVDRLHHSLENRVKEPASLFGVAIGQDLHRALQVREEHRDLLALAFQSTARAEGLLG